MKKNYTLLLLLLVVCLPSLAGPRSFLQAKAIAERQAAKLGIPLEDSEVTMAKSSSPLADNPEERSYYVFSNGEGRGFTIVSGDDRMPDVVGYSAKGTYDAEKLPDNYVNFMKAYEETLAAVLRGDESALANLSQAKALRATSQNKPVAPLLGDIAWNQSAPYNNMCPTYNYNGSRAVTGCVATAMAQIMGYWQYPKSLGVDLPAYRTDSYAISVPTVKKGEAYDWDNILPKYLTGQYTQAQANAIAKLMYHCGVAVNMDYGPSSAAWLPADVMTDVFGYDRELVTQLWRTNYDQREWKGFIDNELQAARPIYYSGQSSGGGHAFVCDGSDDSGLYHINWGWGGYQNGYFDLTILNPDKGGIGSGDAPDGYNRGCSMIIGLMPDNGKIDEPLVKNSDVDAFVSSCDLYKPTRKNVTEAFEGTLNLEVGMRSVKNDFNGYIALAIKNEDGSFQLVSDKAKVSLKKALNDGRYYIYSVSLDFVYPFSVGYVKLFTVSSVDGKDWVLCRNNGGILSLKVRETTLTETDNKELLPMLAADEEILGGMSNSFTLSLKNQANYEFMGLLRVYANTIPEKPEKNTSDMYVMVPAYGSVTRSLTLTPSVGDLYVWVTYADDVLIDAQHFVVQGAEAPVLRLVGITSNATPDDYEMENAYFTYNDEKDRVKLPRINADEAKVTFAIRNDGGTCKSSVYVNCRGVNTGQGKSEAPNLTFKGGATTEYTISVTKGDTREGTIYAYIQMPEGLELDLSSMPDNKISSLDHAWYYPRRKDCAYFYLTGIPSTIAPVFTSGMKIMGGKGGITIQVTKEQSISIYKLSGQKAADLKLDAGEQQTIPVAPGVYIVGGKKIVVI